MAQIQSDGQQSGTLNAALEEWNHRRLGEVMDHIVQTHHPYCRVEGPRLQLLLKQTVAADKDKHPELMTMLSLFTGMNQEIANHLAKEEQTLFPHIARLEASVLSGEPVSWPPFGTVGNPVRIMIVEHGKTNIEIGEMRKLTNGFRVPENAPAPYLALYAALYEGLVAFEHDMEKHVALEEQVLFPRAIAMELEACSKPAIK